MTEPMSVIALGVHVLDVLVRPVQEIPAGQGGQLVEEIRITPAGSAGGTAVTLAKLGARVASAGAIGADAPSDELAAATHLDYLLPNEEQALGLTGAADLIAGAHLLIDRGVGCAAAALVAERLGSDHGEFDLAAADALAARTPTLNNDPREIATR